MPKAAHVWLLNSLFAFRRDQRLIKPDFKALLDGGKRRVTPFFVYLARPNSLGKARLGMIITKKCLPLSVQRNAVKRIIRESFRLHQQLTQGWDVVIISRYRLPTAKTEDLNHSLERYWRELSKC